MLLVLFCWGEGRGRKDPNRTPKIHKSPVLFYLPSIALFVPDTVLSPMQILT